MSLNSVQGGSSTAPPDLKQVLSRLYNRLDASAAATTTDTQSASASKATAAAPTAAQAASTGGATTQLTSDILNVLIGIQASGQTAANANTAETTSQQSPAQQLFAAIDADSDGSITKSEMETFAENNGATVSQADQMYAALDPNNTGAVSEDQFAAAVKAGGQHHGHHGPHGPPPADQVAADMLSAVDSDKDGSVSKSELESYATKAGGSTDNADKAFAALDTDGNGSVTQSEMEAAIKKLFDQPPPPPPASETAQSSGVSDYTGVSDTRWMRLVSAIASVNSSAATTAVAA